MCCGMYLAIAKLLCMIEMKSIAFNNETCRSR
jgi:hypothetical protein